MTGKDVSLIGKLIVPYFQKISIPHGWSLEIPRVYVCSGEGGGEGVSQAKIMVRKESMTLNGYFWKGESEGEGDGEGFKQTNKRKKKRKKKDIHGGKEGYGYFRKPVIVLMYTIYSGVPFCKSLVFIERTWHPHYNLLSFIHISFIIIFIIRTSCVQQ